MGNNKRKIGGFNNKIKKFVLPVLAAATIATFTSACRSSSEEYKESIPPDTLTGEKVAEYERENDVGSGDAPPYVIEEYAQQYENSETEGEISHEDKSSQETSEVITSSNANNIPDKQQTSEEQEFYTMEEMYTAFNKFLALKSENNPNNQKKLEYAAGDVLKMTSGLRQELLDDLNANEYLQYITDENGKIKNASITKTGNGSVYTIFECEKNPSVPNAGGLEDAIPLAILNEKENTSDNVKLAYSRIVSKAVWSVGPEQCKVKSDALNKIDTPQTNAAVKSFCKEVLDNLKSNEQEYIME